MWIVPLIQFHFLLYLYVGMGPKEVQRPWDCGSCCVVPLQVNIQTELVTEPMRERQRACTLSKSPWGHVIIRQWGRYFIIIKSLSFIFNKQWKPDSPDRRSRYTHDVPSEMFQTRCRRKHWSTGTELKECEVLQWSYQIIVAGSTVLNFILNCSGLLQSSPLLTRNIAGNER